MRASVSIGLAWALAGCGGLSASPTDERPAMEDVPEALADAGACAAPDIACDSCAPGDSVWSYVVGGPKEDFGRAVAVTDEGDVFFAGSFAESMELCGETFEAVGRRDGFVVRYDAEGRLLWQRRIGSAEGPVVIEALATDPSGAVYVAGAMPNGTLEATGLSLPRSVLVSRLLPNGDTDWTRFFDAPDSAVATAIAIAADGTVRVAGSFSTELHVGAITLASSGANTAFVAALDALGAPLWAEALGGAEDVVGRDVAIDSRGHSFTLVDALASVTMAVDGHPPITAELIVAEHGPTGQILRLVPIGFEPTLDCACELNALDVAITPDDHVLVAGYYGEPSGSHAHTAFLQEGFIQRFASGGAPSNFARWLGSARGVSVAPDGAVAVVGDFFGQTTIGDVELSAIAFSDAFAAHLDPDGRTVWARSFGTHALDSTTAVSVGPRGALYVVGSTGDHHAPAAAIDFGGGPVPTLDQTDAFLSRYAW